MRWRKAKKRKEQKKEKVEQVVIYGKFLARVFAMVMDMFMLILPINIIIGLIFGFDALKNPETSSVAGIVQISLLFSATVIFWKIVGQTPGKKAFSLKVVDSQTLELAPFWKLIVRYLGYFLSLISLVGFFLPLFREDKKALHDIISGTSVIQVEVN